MNEFFVYAHQSSLEDLRNGEHKVILIGSDFGYPNFGDILQLKGTIEFHQNKTRLTPLPVYAIDSISGPQFIKSMQEYLHVDSILFISTEAVDLSGLDMTLVTEIRNVHSLHLYGGGFLNNMWGAYVLAVSEHFLQEAPGINYIISGQQIGVEIQDALTNHLRKFKPALFGVRDFDSLDLLSTWKIDGYYSFDDAYELLIRLASQIPAAKSKRLIGHLNFSSYTNDDAENRIQDVLDTFNRLHSEFSCHQLTVLNAYNDKRIAVRDSLSSLVAVENDFPYKSYSVLDIVMAAYCGKIDAPQLLAAELGVSCSYHVTMFLHLAGIPCWLISQNSFYHQKARALNGASSFDEFLDNPGVPDYSERIDARIAWMDRLALFYNCNKDFAVDLRFQYAPESTSSRPFTYKNSGVENMKNELQWLTEQASSKNIYIGELLAGKNWLEGQVASKSTHISELETKIAHLQSEIAELQTVRGWLENKRERKD